MLTDDVAAGRAQTAADGGLGLVAVARGDRAARGAADPGTDGRAGAAADMLADHRAQYPAQRAADTGLDVIAGDCLSCGEAEAQ
ncbi:hypothetical protein D3C80_1864530 [compost metagenome]